MTTPTMGSVLLGSSNVEAMKDWYSKAFGVTANDMGAFPFGPVQLFIEQHSEVDGPTREPARVILNLDVDDCRGLEKHLQQVGATWIRPVEQESFGLIGTLADPDGNYVQIIQWGASPESHRER